MVREEERLARASEQPIVGSLPDVPGIGVAMRLKPELGLHLRGLADALLVDDYPGTTLSRTEREMLATATSAVNDCFFCMDSHAEHATAVAQLEGAPAGLDVASALETLKEGGSQGLSAKMAALVRIARTVAVDARALKENDVKSATDAGATDADVQLAVLISAAFCMYNRLVDGFRAKTPPTLEPYRGRAKEIAESGYSAPSPSAIDSAQSAISSQGR